MKRIKLFHLILGILMISGCTPAASLPTASATEPLAEQTTPASTATSAAPIPAGWVSAAVPGQQCKYAISYPPEIEFTDQTPYSRIFAFKLTDLRPRVGRVSSFFMSKEWINVFELRSITVEFWSMRGWSSTYG